MNSLRIPAAGSPGRLPHSSAGDSLAPAFEVPDVRHVISGQRWRELGADSLVVAILSPFLVLSSGWVHRLLLGVVILDIPLQFGTHFFFREDEAARGALGGLSFSMTTIALIGLYASWLLKSLARRGGEARTPLRINLPLAIYLVISGLSLIVAQDVSLSLFEFFLLVQLFLVNLYVANFVRSRQDVLFVVKLLLIGCALASLAIINIKLVGMPPILWGLPWGLPTRIQFDEYAASGYMRIGGTIGSPNNAGGYLSFVLVLAASVLFTRLRGAIKWLAMTALGLGGLALIFTFSRGAWAALALSTAVMLCLFAGRLRRFSWKAPLAGVAILVLLGLPFQDLIAARLFGDDRGAAESRIPLMKLAFRIIEDNPVLGVGSNNFPVVMNRYITSEFRSGFLFTVHNKYLLVWAETGILGLLAYLAFLLGTLRTGWKNWKQSDGPLSTLGLAITAALAGHMLQMAVEVFNGRPLAQLIWTTAGLLTAMQHIGSMPSSAEALSSSA